MKDSMEDKSTSKGPCLLTSQPNLHGGSTIAELQGIFLEIASICQRVGEDLLGDGIQFTFLGHSLLFQQLGIPLSKVASKIINGMLG